VLAVGETPTLGNNIDDRDTWPAQLTGKLRQPVLNGATWSWGFDQMVRRAEELVPLVMPSVLLVIGVSTPSLTVAGFETLGLGYKPYFGSRTANWVLAGTPVPQFGRRVRDIGGPQLIFGYSQKPVIGGHERPLFLCDVKCHEGTGDCFPSASQERGLT
jgi:hypothetical protein